MWESLSQPLALAIHMDSTAWEERGGFSEDSMETPAKPWGVQKSPATFLFVPVEGEVVWVWALGDLPTLFLGRDVNFTAVLPHLFLAHKQTAEH